MVMEILFGQMVKNTMANGKMVRDTEMEQKYGVMAENIPEHSKMINYTVQELCIILMEKNMLVSL